MTSKKQTPLLISELTLRDFFASQVMGWCIEWNDGAGQRMQCAASDAYKMADAMILERDKP